MKKNFKKVVTLALATIMSVAGAMSAMATEAEVPAFDPAGEYNAYMGLQTPGWSFRNAWDDKDYGRESELWNQVTGWDASNNAEVRPGTVNDVVIKGNGTYRVGVTDLGDWCATELGEAPFNLLFVSTDIPLSDDVKITDVKLIVDGSTKHTDAAVFLDPDAKDYVKILVQNIWNADKAEISYYPAPTSSVEIEFTISGFSYDNEEQKAEDDTKASASDDSNKDTNTDDSSDDEKKDDDDSMLPIIIGVVAVVVVVVIVVVVSKKKK